MASTMTEKISIFGHDDNQHTNNHALIAIDDGRVFSTGVNNYGLADIGQISKPVRLPITGVSAVAATRSGSFFLKSDGTVWGASSVLGTDIINLGFSNVIAITAWDNIVYCIKNDNTLWYKNGTGAITQDTTVSAVKQFARGTNHSLYLNTSGVVTATGATGYNKINGANGITGVKQIDATGGDAGSSYFLKEDGTVWVCGTYWGYSGGGALVQLPITNAIKVCVGTGQGDDHSHFFVLRDDGALFAGGYGNYGVLGTGDTTRLTALTDTGLRNVKDVSTGGDSTFIILKSGEILAFGYNGQGQLGIGNTTESILTPTKVLDPPMFHYLKNGVVNTLLTGLNGTMKVQDPFGLRNATSGAIGTVINGVKKFFTIAAVAPNLSLSETSSTVAYPNTKTFTVSRDGTGTITVDTSNSAVATAQISGTTVTITTVKPGSATITVSVAESDGYLADQTTYGVTVTKGTNTLTLSKTSGSVNWNGSDTFTVTANTSGGALSVTPTNNSNSYVNATISNTTVTITGRSYTATAQTITVTSAATDYYESATANYTVTAVNKTNSSFDLSATSVNCDWNSTATVTVSNIVGTGAISVSSNATSNATVAYDSSTKVVTVTGVAYRSSAVTITVSMAANGNYNAASKTFTVNLKQTSPGLTISKTSGTLTYPATDSFTWSRSGSGTVTASSNQTGVATTSNPNSTAASGTITITAVKPSTTKATITVSVAASGNYLAESKTYTATINKGTNTLALSATSGSVAWNGTTTFTVTTNTSGGTLSVTPTNNSNGYVNATISGTTVTVAGRAYTTTAQTITVTSAATDYYNSQTATYKVTAVNRTDSSFDLSASSVDVDWNGTATVNVSNIVGTGAISVSSNATGYATVAYNSSTKVVTVTGKAYRSTAVTITVSIAANGNYNATSKTFTVNVKQTSPGLTISKTSGTLAYPATDSFTWSRSGSGTVTASSNQTGIATTTNPNSTGASGTITVSSVKPSGTQATITVSVAASGNYFSETKIYTATVNKGTNTLALSSSSGSVNYNSTTTFTVSTNTSGGTLSVTPTSNNNSYVNATISGTTVTITGRQATTTAQTITVASAATDYYNSATATYSCTVNKIDNTLVLSATSGSVNWNGTTTFTVKTNTSGGTLSVSPTSGNSYANAKISGTTVTITGAAYSASAVTITVTSAATTNYNSATATYSCTVNRTSPGLTISKTSGTLSYPTTDSFTWSRSGSGTVTASSNQTGVATVNNPNSTGSSGTITVTPVKPSSTQATITVSVAASGNYLAESKTYTATVNKGTNTLTLSATSGSVAWNGTTTFTVKTNTSGGTLSVTPTGTTNSYLSAAISNTTVTITGKAYTATAQTITVTSAATDYYESKTATYSCTVSRTAGSVVLSATSGNVDWNGTLTFTVNTNLSGGALTVSSNATGYATASINTSTKVVTVTGVAYRSSAVTITVNSAANGNYNAASATFSAYVKQTPATFNLSAETVDLAWNSQTTTVNVTNIVGGTLSATSASTTYLTASVNTSTKVITITSKNSYTATALKINVTVAASGNYSATTKQITVNLAKISPNLTLSKTSATLTYPTGDSFTWSRTGSGKVTAASGATGTITCNNPNSTAASGTITVTAVKPNTTAAVITVSVATSGGYLAESKTYTATLNKGTNTLTLSATSGTVTYGTPTTFNVTTNTSNGALSVSSADSNYVTASINTSTKVVTLNCVAYNSTVRNITVTSAATDYYNSQTAVYKATSAKATPTITISPTSSTVVVNSTQTITVTDNPSGGTITAKSANTNYVTVSKTNNTTFVATAKAHQSSSTNVTFDIASTTNYTAATTVATYALTPARIATSLTFSKESINLMNNESTTFTVTRSAGSGTLSVSSANDNVATATISGTAVTVKHVASGTTTITVTCGESGNYDSCTKQISVTCMKALNDYTWAEINAYAQGSILLNYVAIGDTKDIAIDATIPTRDENLPNVYINNTFKATLIGVDHNAVYEGEGLAHFAINKYRDSNLTADLNICFIDTGSNASPAYNDDSVVLAGSYNSGNTAGPANWTENKIRSTVLPAIYAGLPSDLKSVIKNVWKATNIGNSNVDAGVTHTLDQMFLMSEYEVMGTKSYSSAYEVQYQKRYQYFTNGGTRIYRAWHLAGDRTQATYEYVYGGGTVQWQTRSPVSGSKKTACISTSGNTAAGNASYGYGIIPCFVVGKASDIQSMPWRAIAQCVKDGTIGNYWNCAGDGKKIHLEGTVGTLDVTGDYYVRMMAYTQGDGTTTSGVPACQGVGRADFTIDKIEYNSNSNVYAFADVKHAVDVSSLANKTDYFAHLSTNYLNSNIRTNILPQFLETMPADLKNIIAWTTKWYRNGSAYKATRDKIWIYSAKEIGATNANDTNANSYGVGIGVNGSGYAYLHGGTHYMFRAHTTKCYTAIRPVETSACMPYYHTNGTFYSNAGAGVNYSLGITPCFSLGNDSSYITMEDYTWEELQFIAKMGGTTFTDMFALGDSKTVTVNGTVGTHEINNTYKAVFIGYNHNPDIEGANKAHFMIDRTSADAKTGLLQSTTLSMERD